MSTIDKAPSDAVTRQLVQTGTLSQIESAIQSCITAKTDIQNQLSQSKADMLAVRSDMVRGGFDARHAQIEATASTDQDWRARATGALAAIEKRLALLKARRKELLAPARKSDVPAIAMERRRMAIAVSARSLSELALLVQDWLDIGWAVMGSVDHPDGCVLIARYDGPGTATAPVARETR